MGSKPSYVGAKAPEARIQNPPPKVLPRRKLSPGPGLAAREVGEHQVARIHQAMIEVAAENGYKNLKIRDVVARAEVSTRAFYEHFLSKEDCFLQTHDLITRRAIRRMVAAQSGEYDWRERSRWVLGQFIKEFESAPANSRVALIEAYGASEALTEQAWRVEQLFSGLLAECLARPPEGVVVPPLLVQGVIAGVATVSRNRLLSGRVLDLTTSADELINWAHCYPSEVVTELANLDRQSIWRDTTLEAPLPSTGKFAEPWPTSGDRALILIAAGDLASTEGYSKLTASRVRAAAGVSRKKFNAHFDDVEDCYLAALEQRTGRALAQAARAQTVGSSWGGGIYRAISALCSCVDQDAFLIRLCFENDFPPGSPVSRSRRRLIEAILELLSDGRPRHAATPGSVTLEASIGATWSVFFRCINRQPSMRSLQSPATLTYLMLAPVLGSQATISVIQAEQRP
jgi:AcrR family transcriptional regulator